MLTCMNSKNNKISKDKGTWVMNKMNKTKESIRKVEYTIEFSKAVIQANFKS